MKREKAISVDVLVVGGGVSGLSTAIHLADKLKKSNINKRIMVLDKGAEIGSHILSGAIIKTDVLKKLLDKDEYENLPFESQVTEDKTLFLKEKSFISFPFSPPYMDNKENMIISLGKVCRYLEKLAQKRGIEIYSGFSVSDIIYEDEKIVGVKTIDTGLDKEGRRLKNFQKGDEVKANVVIFAEGSRGSLVKKVKEKFNLRKGKEPQVYSLGIKEIWNVPEGRIKEGEVYHTMGYPLDISEEFGGGFIYGLKENRIALGFVVGLDYKDPTLNPHALMQIWKQHSFVKNFIDEGSLVEFGAKTIPEGGWNSISKLYGDNFLIVGDSAGFVAMPALKGVHLSIVSAICAAEALEVAFKENDFSENRLSLYKEYIDNSKIKETLYPLKNFRALMTQGVFLGGLKFGIGLLTKGCCLSIPKLKRDNQTLKTLSTYNAEFFKERFSSKLVFDKKLTFDKDTSVFYSGVNHEEDQPVHLIVNSEKNLKKNIEEYGLPCQYFCPADVYEEYIDKKGNHTLKIHAENCVHCKTCDIKAPNSVITWTPPYGGDGPEYQNM